MKQFRRFGGEDAKLAGDSAVGRRGARLTERSWILRQRQFTQDLEQRRRVVACCQPILRSVTIEFLKR